MVKEEEATQRKMNLIPDLKSLSIKLLEAFSAHTEFPLHRKTFSPAIKKNLVLKYSVLRCARALGPRKNYPFKGESKQR